MKEGQPYAVSATGARAQRRRGAWDKSWSGPIHVATVARGGLVTRANGSFLAAGAELRHAAARRARVSTECHWGGWDGASQCALGRRRRTGWRPTQKASINVARYARLTKGSHVQHVARKAKTSDAAGQQPAVGVAKALLPHRPRWCASRFSRGRAALRCTCTERIQDVISAIICHVRVNADAVKPSPEVWRPARPRGGKL